MTLSPQARRALSVATIAACWAAPVRRPSLNYRHAFHAGNFADLVKHALLLATLDALRPSGEPLLLLDTHAGAGVYDLGGEAARRSGEAQAGVARLMDDAGAPPPLQRLAAAVRLCNGGGGLHRYPGSPWLAAQALRASDAYLGCELRADDGAQLQATLRAGREGPRRDGPRRDGPRIEVVQGDGYGIAARRLASWPCRALLLIDPPYERPDDYVRTAELVASRPAPGRQPALVWTPLKDLETFDAFLGALEATRPHSLVAAQARLRPLDDPMRMNGCAMVLIDAPDLAAQAEAVCGWAATRLGGTGARARVDRLIGAAT